MMTWQDRVPDALARALAARGYTTLTAVQRAVLAAEPRSGDMLITAGTGTGKTVAMGLGIAAEFLAADGQLIQAAAPRALIITPTRELALQVRDELSWLYAGTGARIGSCTGGADIAAERAMLAQGLDLVVGSPGRLRDQTARMALDLSALRVVVLDEADEILSLGFREDLEFVLAATPPGRQTLMFSATLTLATAALARHYQRDALRIAADARAPVSAISFQAVAVAAADRENVIVNILRLHDPRGAIVFCSRRDAAGLLAERLAWHGFKVVMLSGGLSQRERALALAAMREGRARVCVATDLAARGLDLPGLEVIVHADLPTSSETLIHRSGRTGRAGRQGLAVLVVPHGQRRQAEALIARAGLALEWLAAPTPRDVGMRDQVRLLGDRALADPQTDPPTEEEAIAVQALVGAHPAERIALALYRYMRAALPTPVELTGVAGRPEGQGGTWFAIDRGRKANSDLRQLLALIRRLGKLARQDVGRIRIHDAETQFEVLDHALPGFLDALGQRGEPGGRFRHLDPGRTPPRPPRRRPASAWSARDS